MTAQTESAVMPSGSTPAWLPQSLHRCMAGAWHLPRRGRPAERRNRNPGGRLSIPAAQRKAVENLSDLVTNGDELAKLGENLPLATERIQ